MKYIYLIWKKKQQQQIACFGDFLDTQDISYKIYNTHFLITTNFISFMKNYRKKNCNMNIKNDTHVKKVGNTSEFLFWNLLMNLKNKLLKKLVKWAHKNKIILMFTMLHFLKRYMEKHLQITSKSWWYDLQFMRYRAKHTEISNFRSFLAFCPLKTPKLRF